MKREVREVDWVDDIIILSAYHKNNSRLFTLPGIFAVLQWFHGVICGPKALTTGLKAQDVFICLNLHFK